MSDAPAFDPNDPVNALAEKFRHAVLQAVLSVVDSDKGSPFESMRKTQRIQGTFAGVMVGACCALLAHCDEPSHAELRAMLINWLPYYFDVAREIGKLPPLPAVPSPAEAFVNRLGVVASSFAAQAGEGAADLAGGIVSSLFANPELIERFMREGTELLIDRSITPETGGLTYRAANGRIMSPSDLRKARGVQQ